MSLSPLSRRPRPPWLVLLGGQRPLCRSPDWPHPGGAGGGPPSCSGLSLPLSRPLWLTGRPPLQKVQSYDDNLLSADEFQKLFNELDKRVTKEVRVSGQSPLPRATRAAGKFAVAVGVGHLGRLVTRAGGRWAGTWEQGWFGSGTRGGGRGAVGPPQALHRPRPWPAPGLAQRNLPDSSVTTTDA